MNKDKSNLRREQTDSLASLDEGAQTTTSLLLCATITAAAVPAAARAANPEAAAATAAEGMHGKRTRMRNRRTPPCQTAVPPVCLITTEQSAAATAAERQHFLAHPRQKPCLLQRSLPLYSVQRLWPKHHHQPKLQHVQTAHPRVVHLQQVQQPSKQLSQHKESTVVFRILSSTFWRVRQCSLL